MLKVLHPENNATKSDLIEFFQVNSIYLTLGNTINVKTSDSKGIICKRCRRWSSDKQDKLCKRCEKTVDIFYSN